MQLGCWVCQDSSKQQQQQDGQKQQQHVHEQLQNPGTEGPPVLAPATGIAPEQDAVMLQLHQQQKHTVTLSCEQDEQGKTRSATFSQTL